MGTWDRNGRSRCRKEIFRRRAGRLRRMKGSAMLEAMAVILVFLVMASVLFASGRALNRQTVRTLEKNVARDGALTAVRLLAQDIMENELVMGTEAYKNGHLIYLAHPAVWYTAEGGITALDIMLQDLESELLG